MSGIVSKIIGLFTGSRSISRTPFYKIRTQLLHWNQAHVYPEWSSLPVSLEFPFEFWDRVTEIYRHTTSDGHERAVTVWWADGEYVLTESVRGEEARVNIPAQTVKVSYVPVKGTSHADRIITVNEKVYAKKSVDVQLLRNISKVEVSHLFNMHTHPPSSPATGDVRAGYSFFSTVDIRSFLSSGAAITGLVTDHLWLLIKTNQTPGALGIDSDGAMTPEYLIQQLKIRVYRARFGKGVVSYERWQGIEDAA